MYSTERGHLVRINSTDKGDPRTRVPDPLELLAELQQHIPNIGEQTVRYRRVNSSRRRGSLRTGRAASNPSPPRLRRDSGVPQAIAGLRRSVIVGEQVCLVDPRVCPRCGGAMRNKASIHDTYEITRSRKHPSRVPGLAPPAFAHLSRRQANDPHELPGPTRCASSRLQHIAPTPRSGCAYDFP